MNSDFKELLKIFNAAKVRYLIVGGYAVSKYTEPRYTKDLDLWIEASAKNARAVFKALREFGALLANLTEADFSREGLFYQMGRPPARVDILMSMGLSHWRDGQVDSFGASAPRFRRLPIPKGQGVTSFRRRASAPKPVKLRAGFQHPECDSPKSIEGVRFADAWRNRAPTDFDGVPAHVIARDDLIANKRAVGRPQDLMDVTNLLEAERPIEKTPQEPKRKRPKGRDGGIDR